MTGIERWTSRAERIRDGDGYTYADLAHDMVNALGWTAAVDLATALRGHVYGWPGEHSLHQEVKPLYDRLGWQQSALVACWFRDARNRPGARPKERPSGRQPGGWPVAAPAPLTPERSESP